MNRREFLRSAVALPGAVAAVSLGIEAAAPQTEELVLTGVKPPGPAMSMLLGYEEGLNVTKILVNGEEVEGFMLDLRREKDGLHALLEFTRKEQEQAAMEQAWDEAWRRAYEEWKALNNP